MSLSFAGRFALFVAASVVAAPVAQAAVSTYGFVLNGPSESPANASPGTGTGTVAYDDVAKTLSWSISFSGLTGTTSAAHFHATTATSGVANAPSSVANVGVAIYPGTIPGFPLGVTAGAAAGVIDLTQTSSYTGTFLTANGGSAAGAEAGFAAALANGRTYWNIHTSTFGGGEIRGFPVLIPEPATGGLAAVAVAALGAFRRRR